VQTLNHRLKVWIVVAGITLLLLVGGERWVAAQSVVNLQADISQLRLEVNQLRSQVLALSRQRSPLPSPPPASRPLRPEALSDRQMLERLATLAIEAKDRLTALEKRMAQLEQKVKPE
jgi:polyhydroxyalkanoate synthesis regulator phasin